MKLDLTGDFIAGCRVVKVKIDSYEAGTGGVETVAQPDICIKFMTKIHESVCLSLAHIAINLFQQHLFKL